MKRVLVSCDHRGTDICGKILDWCKRKGYTGVSMGPDTEGCVDYPDFATPLAEKVVKSRGNIVGVLICGWGNGMAIAANKVKGARAALCTSKVQAQYARWHNNANILVISAETSGLGMIEEMLESFMVEKFEGQRHGRRVKKITNYERDKDYRTDSYRKG